MSQENVETVRRIEATWNREGSPVPSGLLDPEIEWVNPSDAVEPGTRHGIEAFATAVRAVNATWADEGIEIDQFIDAGERVVVLARWRGRGHASGLELEDKQGFVWTLRKGKAVRYEWFSSAEQALEAAGLSE
jgi:ketosteroid isomerase-like protein